VQVSHIAGAGGGYIAYPIINNQPILPHPSPRTDTLGIWTKTGNMAEPRTFHSATHLADDTVLVAAGRQSETVLIPFSEIYDPVQGTWQRKGKLITPRFAWNSLVTLHNGNALLVGGLDDAKNIGTNDDIGTCELYDPVTGAWTKTGSLNTPRRGATITLLSDGKVLVAGGAHGVPDANQFVGSAEIYDPEMGVWTYTGNNLQVARQNANAVLLRDGRVLVAGGEGPQYVYGQIIELFDPKRGTWSSGSPMPWGWMSATLTILKDLDERVLLVGGGRATAALYDPKKNTWTHTRPMSTPRSAHTATLLPDGRVLVVGGASKDAISCEVYDPTTNIWSPGPSLLEPRVAHVTVTLSNGDILIIGGRSIISNSDLASCERLQLL
jgi:hypothetical protein